MHTIYTKIINTITNTIIILIITITMIIVSDGKVTLEEWKKGGLTTIPLLVLLGLEQVRSSWGQSLIHLPWKLLVVIGISALTMEWYLWHISFQNYKEDGHHLWRLKHYSKVKGFPRIIRISPSSSHQYHHKKIQLFPNFILLYRKFRKWDDCHSHNSDGNDILEVLSFINSTTQRYEFCLDFFELFFCSSTRLSWRRSDKELFRLNK